MKVYHPINGNCRSFLYNRHHGKHHGMQCRINEEENPTRGCVGRNNQRICRENSPKSRCSKFGGMDFPHDLSKRGLFKDWMKHHHGHRHHWKPHNQGPHHPHNQWPHQNHGPHNYHGHHHHHHGPHKHPHHHHGPHHGHGHQPHRPHQQQLQHFEQEGCGGRNPCQH